MTQTVGLNHSTELPHRLEDPHQHIAAHSRADRLVALTQFLAFIRGARPASSQADYKPAPTRTAIIGDP